MSRRHRLLCSLPLIALTFAAVGPARVGSAAPVQPDAPSTLIDVKDANDRSAALLASQATDKQAWTILWDDLAVKQGDAPVVSGGSSLAQSLEDTTLPSQAPAIIAAPLPPAIVSGLIGLVGVYAYKRRNRFANG